MGKILAGVGVVVFFGVMVATAVGGGSFADCIGVATACVVGAGLSAWLVYWANQGVAQRSG